MLEVRPITFREASEYIREHHRHHSPTTGCKYCISVWEGGVLHGVAVCGRPVARRLDNGEVCEVNRLCTDGYRNACSKLYGACARIAKEMGYKKIITYILDTEPGTSLKAAGFICEGTAGGKIWTGKRQSGKNGPHQMKQRWTKDL